MTELVGLLNRRAGTTGLEMAGAANTWAGTSGLETLGALNAKAGTSGLGLNGVMNKLAGTTGLDAQGAAAVAGGYLNLTGAADNYVSTPDSAPLSITGDIDIRCHVLQNVATTQTIMGKFGTTSARSYRLDILSTNIPRFVFSLNGTASVTAVASTAIPTPRGEKYWIRATRASATGAVNFYTSSDGGSTWTVLGTEQSASTGNMHDNASIVEIGSFFTGTSQMWNGRVYYVEIRSGIGGDVVGSFNPGAVTVTGARTPDTYSDGTNTWTLNGSALSWQA